jgi:hypothetical protein
VAVLAAVVLAAAVLVVVAVLAVVVLAAAAEAVHVVRHPKKMTDQLSFFDFFTYFYLW